MGYLLDGDKSGPGPIRYGPLELIFIDAIYLIKKVLSRLKK